MPVLSCLDCFRLSGADEVAIFDTGHRLSLEAHDAAYYAAAWSMASCDADRPSLGGGMSRRADPCPRAVLDRLTSKGDERSGWRM